MLFCKMGLTGYLILSRPSLSPSYMASEPWPTTGVTFEAAQGGIKLQAVQHH